MHKIVQYAFIKQNMKEERLHKRSECMHTCYIYLKNDGLRSSPQDRPPKVVKGNSSALEVGNQLLKRKKSL